MDVLEQSNVFPSIPESFFRQVRATTISMHVDAALVSHSVSDKLKEHKKQGRYLLLTGTCVATGDADVKTYEKIINSVIDVLGIENTISKCHPRFKDLYGKEKELRQIPSYIPGNLRIPDTDGDQ